MSLKQFFEYSKPKWTQCVSPLYLYFTLRVFFSIGTRPTSNWSYERLRFRITLSNMKMEWLPQGRKKERLRMHTRLCSNSIFFNLECCMHVGRSELWKYLLLNHLNSRSMSSVLILKITLLYSILKFELLLTAKKLRLYARTSWRRT